MISGLQIENCFCLTITCITKGIGQIRQTSNVAFLSENLSLSVVTMGSQKGMWLYFENIIKKISRSKKVA